MRPWKETMYGLLMLAMGGVLGWYVCTAWHDLHPGISWVKPGPVGTVLMNGSR